MAILRSLYVGLHMLAGALWGYAFASAFYANLEARDSRSLAYALLAVETVIAIVMLLLSVKAFRELVARSPCRQHPYHRHREAVANIRRGLLLNPTGNAAREQARTEYAATELLAAARRKLDTEGRTIELSDQLHRFVRDEDLLERVQRVPAPAKLRAPGGGPL